MIDCIHWQDAGGVGYGRCAAGHKGGFPSHGACAACALCAPRGASTGNASSSASPLDSDEIAHRRAICKGCPKNRGLTLFTVACDCATCRAKPLATWVCPLNKWNPTPIPPPEIGRLFDAVWCINLDASRDRWQTFQQQLAGCDWPFGPVTRFPALHGDTIGVPDHFHQGGGAWGCLQSHRRVLELSLMAGHERILVIEDDADLRPTFGQSARTFLKDLGDMPWDCLMLGGQHMSPPAPFRPGVVRAALPRGIQRTHCLAMSRSFMRELYRHWSGPIDQHCDWALGPFAARHRTYAPERFIIGQRGGASLITGGSKPAEWWNPPKADAPVVWLRCPREVIEATRDIFHAGYRRNAEGVCVGLAEVFDEKKNPTIDLQAAALRRWIAMIQWECESRGDGAVCTIWYPGVNERVVRSVPPLMEIEANCVEEARDRRSRSFRE